MRCSVYYTAMTLGRYDLGAVREDKAKRPVPSHLSSKISLCFSKMRNLILRGILSIAICLQCVSGRKDASRQGDKTWEVPLDEFESIVKTGSALVVDVREPHEVSDVRIDAKNYVNIPLSQVESSLHMSSEDFEWIHSVPKPAQEDEFVFICRSGKRSENALTKARNLDYKRTRHFNGGTLLWAEKHPDMVVRENEMKKKEEL